MKKSTLILSLTGFGLSILSFAFLFLIPVFMGPNALYTLEGFGGKLGQLFVSLFSFSTVRFMQVVWIVVFAMLLSLWVAGIVVIAMRKRKIGAVELVLFFFEFHLFLFYCLLAFNPGWEEANGSFWTLGDKFVSLNSQFEQWGDFGLAGLVVAAKRGGLLGKGWTLFILAVILLSIVGFLLSFSGFIVDLCTSPYSSSPAEKAIATKPKAAAVGPSVIIVHDDEMNPEVKSVDSDGGTDSSNEKEGAQEEKAPMPSAPAFYPGSGVQGPILVQYINTFSGESQQNSKKSSSTSVPVSEIQGAIHEEKALSVEDIRKIVREELTPKKEEKQPVIISIPSPAVEEETTSLTADDVRRILTDELKKSMGSNEGDVLLEEPKKEEVEKEANPASASIPDTKEEKVSELDRVSKEDLRALIAEELAKAMPKEEPVPPVNSSSLSAEDIRAIIQDEFAKRKEEPAPSPISSDSLRDIIREELRDSAAPLPQAKVQPVTVVLSVPSAPAKPEQSPKTVEAPASPAPVEQTAPKRRVVGETNPNLPPHDKIIRIPFQTRMKNAEKDMADNYNELKSEIMSYGVKSRISNKGDTFRLHKVTFVRIAVAGKGLKLYFALDPKDYANSPFPIQDVSHKKVYADIPLVFKVKSGLSMKRAKDLIADVMRKNGLSQGKIENKNWVNEIPEADEEDEIDDSSED